LNLTVRDKGSGNEDTNPPNSMRSLFERSRDTSVLSWISGWRDRLPEVAIRWRFVTLAVVITVTMLAAYFARGVRFDGSVEIWFLEGDPQIQLYHDFRDRFGKEQFIVVGLFPESVFTVEFLEKLSRFTNQVAELPLAGGVMSLANAKVLKYEDERLTAVPILQSRCQRASQPQHANLLSRPGDAL
jgi:predicted RND superfamily exporter protein